MNTLEKISKARQIIKNSNLKKIGKNNHSHYDYYTPEQINMLVNNACDELKLLNIYELKRDEKGLIAELTVYNIEDIKDFKVFQFVTDIPSITATNVAQQIGGCMTYSERYALMFIYDIKDNNLDFDAESSVKKQKAETKPNPSQTNLETREITMNEVETKWNGKLYKGNIVYIDNIKIVVPEEQNIRLKNHPKYKQS